ncbi:hypothetical protein M422DRAFT_269694, partial [Sphaerobolus stellatus SS14]
MSNEKNGFVSENSMDLDMPPQTLQIPESPLKTGKGATTPELISKERGKERPTPLTPVGIESSSSDGEVEGAIVVDTPPAEPTTQENLNVTKKLKPSDDIPATEQSETQAGDSTTVAGTVPHVRAIVQEIPMAEINPVSEKKRGRKPKIEANEVVSTSEATEPATTKCMSTRACTKKGGSEADKHPVLFVAGGLSPRSSAAVVEDVAMVEKQAEKEKLAHMTTISGRRSKGMMWRSYGVWIPEQAGPLKFPDLVVVSRAKAPIVFVFSGQGPQHWNTTYIIDHMDAFYELIVGQSLLKKTGLFNDVNNKASLDSTWLISLILPSIAIFQMALFDLLASFNVHPNIVIGHSAGETALLYTSGAGSQEMALEIAIKCGEVKTLVEKPHATGWTLELGCYNAPAAYTLSGERVLGEEATDLAKSCGLFAAVLRTKVLVHSKCMRVCEEQYLAEMNAIFKKYPGDHTPQVTTYSTFTGLKFKGSFMPEYFWENAVQPVRFSEANAALLEGE